MWILLAGFGEGLMDFSSPRAAVGPSFYFQIHTGSLLLLNPDHCSLHLDSKHGATTVNRYLAQLHGHSPFGPPWGLKGR